MDTLLVIAGIACIATAIVRLWTRPLLSRWGTGSFLVLGLLLFLVSDAARGAL